MLKAESIYRHMKVDQAGEEETSTEQQNFHLSRLKAH